MWIPTSNDLMRTARRNVEAAQQATDDLQNECNTTPDDEKNVLALDANEEPEKHDEEWPDDLLAQSQALKIKNMIDMEVFDTADRRDDKNLIDGRRVLRRKRSRHSESQFCGHRARENLLTTNCCSADRILQMSTCKIKGTHQEKTDMVRL